MERIEKERVWGAFYNNEALLLFRNKLTRKLSISPGSVNTFKN
jgi:hypothetical protein